MKRIIILFLCPLLIFALSLIGCDLDMPDLSTIDWGGDPPYHPDSSAVHSALLELAVDTVSYAPGSTAEVAGYVQVYNY